MAVEVAHEALSRIGRSLNEVPRPMEDIAVALGSLVNRAPAGLLGPNKGLCTDTTILIKDDDTRYWVRRFTIAHELGHQWLGLTAKEWECSAFAGSMLIPVEDVAAFLQATGARPALTLAQWAEWETTGNIMTRLVHRYGVGYHAMIRGLADYGHIAGVEAWTSQLWGTKLYEEYERHYRHLNT